MKYQQAIKEAKEKARANKVNYMVFEHPRKHWWSRRSYGYALAKGLWVCGRPTVICLTITPSGTIVQ